MLLENLGFYQLKHGIEDISNEMKKEIILEHFDAMLKFHGPMVQLCLENYFTLTQKRLYRANEFRDIVNKISDIDVMRDMIENFF